MVDVNKLRSRMVLAGYNQKTLTEECRKKGYKVNKNTLSAKFCGRSKITCDDADMFIDVLKIEDPIEKCEIFLA